MCGSFGYNGNYKKYEPKINPTYGNTYCGSDLKKALNYNEYYSKEHPQESKTAKSCIPTFNILALAEFAGMSQAHYYRILNDDTKNVSVKKIISAAATLPGQTTDEKIEIMKKGIIEKYDPMLEVVREALDEGICDTETILARIDEYINK